MHTQPARHLHRVTVSGTQTVVSRCLYDMVMKAKTSLSLYAIVAQHAFSVIQAVVTDGLCDIVLNPGTSILRSQLISHLPSTSVKVTSSHIVCVDQWHSITAPVNQAVVTHFHMRCVRVLRFMLVHFLSAGRASSDLHVCGCACVRNAHLFMDTHVHICS